MKLPCLSTSFCLGRNLPEFMSFSSWSHLQSTRCTWTRLLLAIYMALPLRNNLIPVYFKKQILFTNPFALAGYDTRLICKRSLTGLNSEFSFSLTSCLTTAEEPSLSYYLPIAGGSIIGFIPFPRVLVLCEMQSDALPVKLPMQLMQHVKRIFQSISYTTFRVRMDLIMAYICFT